MGNKNTIRDQVYRTIRTILASLLIIFPQASLSQGDDTDDDCPGPGCPAIVSGLNELGLSAEELILTDEQILQVEEILNSQTDTDDEKIARINALLGL